MGKVIIFRIFRLKWVVRKWCFKKYDEYCVYFFEKLRNEDIYNWLYLEKVFIVENIKFW